MHEKRGNCEAHTPEQAIEALGCPECGGEREITGRDEMDPIVIFQWRCGSCRIEGTCELELTGYVG